jgi:hypothetical protein
VATADEPDDHQTVCPGCAASGFPIHILPSFDDEANGYVALRRCERCWGPYLDETRSRIARAQDWSELESLGIFLERRAVFLHEFRRGDPLPVVRTLFGRMIDLIQSGAIRLSARSREPAHDMAALAAEMKQNETLAEAAYDAMYTSRPSMAKDCFDDARGYFTKAIDIAQRAGLDDEVARLTARRDHVVSVYNSQFRGLR